MCRTLLCWTNCILFLLPTVDVNDIPEVISMSTFSVNEVVGLSPTAPELRFSSRELLVHRGSLDNKQRLRLERIAYENANVPESYDIAVSDGHLLQTPCGRGIASVLPDGKFWHIAGGLLAPEPAKANMIQWLYDLSVHQKKTIAVYNVAAEEAATFQAAGFVVNKFGEEPVMDLCNVNWSGKVFEWVRRQTNFCERAGLQFAEVQGRKDRQRIADTLMQIMHEDFCDRTYDQPLRLLEGQFDPHFLQRRRLFVAKLPNGQVEAFLAASPMYGGRSWAFESYRKRKDATRGATPFLFRKTIDSLKAEGAECVSLCLVPGRGVNNQHPGKGDWRIQKALSIWFKRLDFLFNVKGQDHFKSRFRPRYVDRYLCVAPQNTTRSLWSFLKTTGATRPNWRNLANQVRHRVRS